VATTARSSEDILRVVSRVCVLKIQSQSPCAADTTERQWRNIMLEGPK